MHVPLLEQGDGTDGTVGRKCVGTNGTDGTDCNAQFNNCYVELTELTEQTELTVEAIIDVRI